MAETREQLNTGRNTESLVIDHFTTHAAAETVSVHVLEKDAEGKTIGGRDIDGVTKDELGITGDFIAGITSTVLVNFVKKISNGDPVTIDVKPEPAGAAE
jgi:hypothetical protein